MKNILMMIIAIATLAITGCKKDNTLQREQIQGNWKMNKYYKVDGKNDTTYIYQYHQLFIFSTTTLVYGKSTYNYTIADDAKSISFTMQKNNDKINIPDFVNAEISPDKMKWNYRVKDNQRVFIEFIKK